MPNLIFVPGFTQTHRDWNPVMSRLSIAWKVQAVDIPVAPTFHETVSELGETGGKGHWIGYSMGGRLALRLAFQHPELVQSLTMVSSSAGLPTEAQRAQRVEADNQWIEMIEQHGTKAFLYRWLRQELFATLDDVRSIVKERQYMAPATLIHHLRVLGTGVMEPMWDLLDQLTMPVLLLTGRKDHKFSRMNRHMSTMMKKKYHIILAGGHALPLENPSAVASTISAFLSDKIEPMRKDLTP